MTFSGNDLHTYVRSIDPAQRSSLSVIASRIPPAARVLDLGTGTGALGKYLQSRHPGTLIDGVTYNREEAAQAAAYYRRIEVDDLDTCELVSLFAKGSYDYIVCADVLEHLRNPAHILKASQQLLAPDGRLLISVPNAAYCGLIAELLGGDFRYREEGLLDRTHLRFFTRRSLLRFLADANWQADTIETVTADLHASEFRFPFDALPPSVARYLLSTPDALTYQFIAVAQYNPNHNTSIVHEPADETAALSAERGEARFSARLYLGGEHGYTEHDKLTATGIIGQTRQTLSFALPATTPTRLRLDPADRAGFLHLYRLRLTNSVGETLWSWEAGPGALEAFGAAEHNEIAFSQAWHTTQAAVLLLYGDDPRIELPIPAHALSACAGGAFDVELGWPMSADYLTLSHTVGDYARQLGERAAQLHSAQVQLHSAQAQTHDLAQTLQQTRTEADQRRLDLERQLAVNEHQAETLQTLSAEYRNLQRIKTIAETERNGLIAYVHGIENSTVFRATRPLVRLKMSIDRLLSGQQHPVQTPDTLAIQPPDNPVDVIVPVYRGLGDTRRCIESALTAVNRTPFRLVVINDASPEQDVTDYLRQLQGHDKRLLLLENEHNLGFVATVNRGMRFSGDRDVVLLNSDAEVANDWLDRLRHAAWSDRRVASVTPFSNNATICSYPRFCADNELPPGYNTATLDALFAATNAGQVEDIPTAIGFCMYIRRDCLDAIGLFDVESFGKGYGEENDFCMRAYKAGWRNLFALDTFVRHAGGVSFGDSKSPREREAGQVLLRLHPEYDAIVHAHIVRDPAREARLAVDLARVRAANRPVILAVLHGLGGGTERHVTELAAHLNGQASFFALYPGTNGDTLLKLIGPGEAFQLTFRLPEEFDSLLDALRGIGIAHIHYHHLLGHSPLVRDIPSRLGLAFDFTAHDFYALCPQISLTDRNDRYCGELGPQQCRDCLRHTPVPGGADIETWRSNWGSWLTRARYVFAPSRDTARRIATLAPQANTVALPHPDIVAISDLPHPMPHPLDSAQPLRVAIIGALSPIKGADILEKVAIESARGKHPIEFHLLGYAYRKLRTQPRAALTVHGAYEENELSTLLDWLKPDIVWFPSQVPETYSYTLSACLQHGLPVAATDLGAFPERLASRAWSWICPWQSSPAEWIEFFTAVRRDHFLTGQEPPRPQPLAPGLSHDITYHDDYLRNIAPVAEAPALTTEFLTLRRPEQPTGIAAARSHAKQRLLYLLVRLRRTAPLQIIVRSIPLRWQTRLKGWLLR